MYSGQSYLLPGHSPPDFRVLCLMLPGGLTCTQVSYLFPQSSALTALVPLLARSRQTEWARGRGSAAKRGLGGRDKD